MPYHEAIKRICGRIFRDRIHECLEQVKLPTFLRLLAKKWIQFTSSLFHSESPCLSSHKHYFRYGSFFCKCSKESTKVFRSSPKLNCSLIIFDQVMHFSQYLQHLVLLACLILYTNVWITFLVINVFFIITIWNVCVLSYKIKYSLFVCNNFYNDLSLLIIRAYIPLPHNLFYPSMAHSQLWTSTRPLLPLTTANISFHFFTFLLHSPFIKLSTNSLGFSFLTPKLLSFTHQ